MYIIEDEFHFFYECPTYDDLRDIYFKVSWINNRTLDKCYTILNTNIKPEVYNTAKFIKKWDYFNILIISQLQMSVL